MQRVIRKRIRHHDGGIDLVADLHAVVAANVGRPGRSSAAATSRQDAPIVQRRGGPDDTADERKGRR